jgi:hypothetical protein
MTMGHHGMTGCRQLICMQGETVMKNFPMDAEPGVESQLVDLSAVPLAVLRNLDGTAMRRSLVHVVEQLRYTRVSAEQECRVD